MLEINKEYIVNIEALGYEGEGIARINGYPVFIQGALIGERIKIKIIKSKKKFAFGEILEIIDKSDNRKVPDCIYFEKCGGCTFEHLKYDGQLEFKTNRVKECIRKIGGLDDNIVLPALGMKDGYRYRNKGQFHVDFIDNRINIGFYSEKSHKVIDIDSCLIQDEESEIIIRIIRKWMKKYSIVPAKKDGAFFSDGILRNIVIRKAFKTNEIMVILVTLRKEIPYIDELIKELNSNVTDIRSIIQNINDKDTNWVMGEECITLYGQNYITDYIGDFKFNISALSFFQVNPYQTEVLYNKALEYADLSGDEVVFDAYCGTGTITLFLSQKAKKVYGVEIIEQAIENAKINAKLNDVSNAEFFAGKSEEIIPKLIQKGIRPNVIVVDPPRKGCDIKLLDSIGKAKSDRVVYVSCDPSTLARDLKYLEEKGYKTIKVQPVDMFPWTKHVESIAMLTHCDLDKKNNS